MVKELHLQGNRNRREWLASIVSALAVADMLRPELTEREALDRAWMLTDPSLYFRAVDECGWSDARYERWLSGLLYADLLREVSSTQPSTARNQGER